MVAGMRSYLAATGMDVANALDQALDDGYIGLWVTGDMTWEFGPEKNFAKLLEYEWRLEELFHRRPELWRHLPVPSGYATA